MKAFIFSKQIHFAPAFTAEGFAAYVARIQAVYEQRFTPAMLANMEEATSEKVLFAAWQWKREISGGLVVDRFFHPGTKDLIRYIHNTDALEVYHQQSAEFGSIYEQGATLRHCSAFSLDHIIAFLETAGIGLYWNIKTRTKYFSYETTKTADPIPAAKV